MTTGSANKYIYDKMLVLATHPNQRLRSVAKLFQALHENDIVYCNLKGNEQHLRVSLTGESDVDLLFDKSQKAALESVLSNANYKRFDTIREKRVNDIVDFFSLDTDSGKLIHLHIHFEVSIGRRFLKEYSLRISHRILSTRIFNEEFGVYCIHPGYELMLLLLTESLKLRNRDWLSGAFPGSRKHLSEKLMYQYRWLRGVVHDEEIDSIAGELFSDAASVSSIVKSGFDLRLLRKLAPLVRKEFSRWSKYSRPAALLTSWYSEALIICRRKVPTIVRWPVLTKRFNPRGGAVVALSGMSEQTGSAIASAVMETFGKKIDTYKVIFRPGMTGPVGSIRLSNLPELATGLGTLKKIAFVRLARRKGALVICVGYPERPAENSDGPAAGDVRRSVNPIWQFLRTFYHPPYPDIIFHPKHLRDPIDQIKAGIPDRRVSVADDIQRIKEEIWKIL